MDQPPRSEIRATYRALLARGLEPTEAANLTGFLHGLPSANLRWSLREVEALISQRRVQAALAAADASSPTRTSRSGRRT